MENYAWPTIWDFFDRSLYSLQQKVLKFNMSFHDSIKKKIQNITAKLIDISAKNLDDSEVLSCDFPGHKNLSILIDLSGLCNLTGLNSL